MPPLFGVPAGMIHEHHRYVGLPMYRSSSTQDNKNSFVNFGSANKLLTEAFLAYALVVVWRLVISNFFVCRSHRTVAMFLRMAVFWRQNQLSKGHHGWLWI